MCPYFGFSHNVLAMSLSVSKVSFTGGHCGQASSKNVLMEDEMLAEASVKCFMRRWCSDKSAKWQRSASKIFSRVGKWS